MEKTIEEIISDEDFEKYQDLWGGRKESTPSWETYVRSVYPKRQQNQTFIYASMQNGIHLTFRYLFTERFNQIDTLYTGRKISKRVTQELIKLWQIDIS